MLVAVTGPRKPYLFDLPHLLSLPAGFEFRFRYRHPWVSSNIRDRLARSQTFVGEELVALFHSEHHGHLLPLRRCRVVAVENVGPMVLLTFELGSFAQVGLELTREPAIMDVSTALGSLAEQGLKLVDRDRAVNLREALPRGKYLQAFDGVSDPGIWQDKVEAAAWAPLVRVLQGEPSVSGVPFFFVDGFRDQARAAVKPTSLGTWSPWSKTTGYRLVEDRRYDLRLVQWSEPPEDVVLPEVRVQCRYDEAAMALEGAWNVVVGRYDVLQFTFVMRRPSRSELSVIAEPRKPADGSSAGDAKGSTPSSVAWQAWPVIFVARIPVAVRHRWGRVILLGVIGTLALASYAFPPTWFGLPQGAYQVGGLAVAFYVLGEYMERFVKAREHVMKLGGAPKAPPSSPGTDNSVINV